MYEYGLEGWLLLKCDSSGNRVKGIEAKPVPWKEIFIPWD